jgi:hypothetical protein
MPRKGRTPNLPNLHEYLEASAKRFPPMDSFDGPALMGATILSALVGFGLLEMLGPVRAAILTLVVVLPSVAYGLFTLRKRGRPPKTPEQVRKEQAAKLYRTLWNKATQTKKLHKLLNPAAAALLEEGARNWLRVQRALAGPIWGSPNLPGHWKQIRERSLSAAEHAMADLALLVEPFLDPQQPPKPAFAQVVDDVMDAIMPTNEPLPLVELLPIEFEPARQIAEKLKLLASEVEASAREVALVPESQEALGSPSDIERTLSELRAIREAEGELRQQVGGQDG